MDHIDSRKPLEAPRPSVRLLASPRRSPSSLAERSAVAALTRGAMPLGDVVSAVARDLYRDALRHGGWTGEIGDVGRGLFVADAARAMREANGVLWSIGGLGVDRIKESA